MRRMAMAVGIGLMSAATVAAQTAPTDGRSIKTIASLDVRTSDGAPLRLAARIDPHKPTLIAFWASWCLPCMIEAPKLAGLRRTFGSRYNFVYVDRRDGEPDPRQPQVAIDQFLAHAGMTAADYVVADVATYRRIVGADMATIPDGTVGIPRVYLFDRQGRQVYTALGYSEAGSGELAQRLRDVIAAQ